MSKPPARRVPSDDCAITIDGETYYPHEGESVWLAGTPSVGELQAFWRFNRAAIDREKEPGEGASNAEKSEYNLRLTDRLSSTFEDLCSAIALRIVDWDWTDDRGEPLPKPDGTSGPMKALRTEELNYLNALIQNGEAPAERGNGLKPTATSSSGKAASRSRRG